MRYQLQVQPLSSRNIVRCGVQIAHVRVRDLRRAIVALLARAVEVVDEAVSAILL